MRLGPVSLVIAVGGLLASAGAVRLGWLADPWWQVLVTGFEAATIGGLADWFAVSALFREIPLPGLARHTNIIVRNRARISDGLADFVVRDLLDTEHLRAHLAPQPLARELLVRVATPERRGALVVALRGWLGRLAPRIAGPEVRAQLEPRVRAWLADPALAAPLARWLHEALATSGTQRAWDEIAPYAQRALADAELHAWLAGTLKTAARDYAAQRTMGAVGLVLGERLGLVAYDGIATHLLARGAQEVDAMRSDPAHELRARLERALGEGALGLAGGADGNGLIALIQRQLSGHAQVGEVVAGLLRRIGGELEQALADPASALSARLTEVIETTWNDLQTDPLALAALDRHLVEGIVALVDGQRPMLRALIVAGLARHSDTELVRQIEGRIGDDLQYIRLNGAVVGGVVGVVLAVVGRLLAAQ